MRRFATVAVLIAGVAVVGLPTDLTSLRRPWCAGGLCDVCPVVATVVASTGERLNCVA